ncbi:glycosyltransferase [Flavobacterium gawalongense]|uniref:Glycosyltransferase n=1 Tax=Flavobacterium gawalongense TaxID=2594432 RepID=A0ABY3CWF3_9FLAO|nr:glycosyltransferase [Flavobacterium gawalongense]TRX04459.1 glycosyltransferase [Flavobacterium gawalongense]TRX10349.1 glycosyltransferase [Flavobacterium gawalongense]
MYDIVCSLVIYKNERIQLLEAINSFLDTDLTVKIVLIDNSPNDNLKDIKVDPRVEYFFNPSNPGYGAAHNIGIRKYSDKTQFYLILNPDIYYSKGVMETILSFMNTDEKIGLVMPKVLYPDGRIQYLAKLIPSPFVFFARRFLPFSYLKKRISDKFELRFSGYNTIMEVPYLSGCFMVFRTEVLKKINGFDENIFMHMEDLDITRRCHDAGYKTIFYPNEIVYHDHLFKSFLTIANLKMYFTSAFYYYNKWGWFFDKKRIMINKKTIKQIKAVKANWNV